MKRPARPRRRRTSPFDRLVDVHVPYVLSESTRIFIENLVRDLLAEDMKDPKIRKQMRDTVSRAYGQSARRFRSSGAR